MAAEDQAESGHSDIVARAQQGDREAFGLLVRKYQRRVFSAALHITGSVSDADDVAQEAFVRAFRKIDSFDGRSEFFTWLYRITINTALNHLRTRKRGQRLEEAGAVAVAQAGGRPERLGETSRGPAQTASISQDLRAVLDAVAGLSESLRVTLVLATVEEMSYRQISEILEIPEGTVAWRINEARTKLKKALGSDLALDHCD